MSAQRGSLVEYHWVRDDAEEDLVGADWHQKSIASLANGLRRVARRAQWAWHVGNQLPLVAWHPDGTPWTPSPDVMVHPHAGPQDRERMVVRTDGLPALIIEVASKSTWHIDVGLDPGARDGAKAFEYLALGVPEYLVFDPTGEYVAGQCRGWRLRDGRQEPWVAGAEGRYHSALGVSFSPEDIFLRIVDPEGRPVLLDIEVTDLEERAAILARENAAQAQEITAQARELADKERQTAAQAREITALRAQLEQLRNREKGL